jgi:hypothetical protein
LGSSGVGNVRRFETTEIVCYTYMERLSCRWKKIAK